MLFQVFTVLKAPLKLPEIMIFQTLHLFIIPREKNKTKLCNRKKAGVSLQKNLTYG